MEQKAKDIIDTTIKYFIDNPDCGFNTIVTNISLTLPDGIDKLPENLQCHYKQNIETIETEPGQCYGIYLLTIKDNNNFRFKIGYHIYHEDCSGKEITTEENITEEGCISLLSDLFAQDYEYLHFTPKPYGSYIAS